MYLPPFNVSQLGSTLHLTWLSRVGGAGNSMWWTEQELRRVASSGK
jgi:hypothetical protein